MENASKVNYNNELHSFHSAKQQSKCVISALYGIQLWEINTTSIRQSTDIPAAKPLLETLQDKTMLANIATLRKDVQRAISSLSGYLQKIGTLKEVISYITSAINLIRAQQSMPQIFLATKQSQLQNMLRNKYHFFSTKGKRKKAAVRLQKPTAKEKDYNYMPSTSTKTLTSIIMVLTSCYLIKEYTQ